jgi:xylose dehydrogenase (NAD/NADP)
MSRWGILSTARINRAVIPALRASSGSELLAVASRDATRGRAFADEHGIPKSFGSYEELVAADEIDAVYISLPNHLHAEWTIRALRGGKHVLCEKPLALSVEEVDAIAAAARDAGRVVAEAFMYRHHPQTLKVRSLVDSGAVGALRLVRGSFSFPLSREGDVRLDPAMGGGCLWDVGCYPISYARFLVGSEPIQASGWQRLGPTGVDVDFLGRLVFPGDVALQFDASFAAPFRTALEVVGSDGTIRISHSFKPGPSETLLVTRGDREEEVSVSGPEELYLGEIADFERAVAGAGRPAVSLEDSRGNVAAIRALLASARDGEPVAPVTPGDR